MKKPVVDVSRVVTAVHQNHDYRHHSQGKAGVWYGEEAGSNYRLSGGWNHLRTIADSTEVLRADGLKPNTARHWAAVKRYVRQAGRIALYNIAQPIWFFLLGITSPPSRLGAAHRDPAAFSRESVTVARDASMSVPLVTILIDAYNYGQYIEEAVESALAQEFPREQREILVVDDGSTDDTAERLKKYGDAIRYLRKTNGGQASAFNFGFAGARGEIIATLDADDMWLPQKLRRVCETFQKQPDTGMVYHRTHMWSGREEMQVDNHFSEVSGRVPESGLSLLRYSMVATSCLAFRRSALDKILPVPEALRSQADAYLTALIIFVAPVTPFQSFSRNTGFMGRIYFTSVKASRRETASSTAWRCARSFQRKSVRGWNETVTTWLRRICRRT